MAILKSKPAPDPVDEVEELKKKIEFLQKAARIDADDLELKQIEARHDEEKARLKQEQEKKRISEQEKKKTDRKKEIEKTFSDEIGKKIRLFRIVSDESGRRAEFIDTITCPKCGNADLPVVHELKEKLVETFEAYRRDPVLLMENNRFNSLGFKEMHCYGGCDHRFVLHYQVSL